MIRPRRAQVVVEWIPNRHDSSVHFEDAISPKVTRSLDYVQMAWAMKPPGLISLIVSMPVHSQSLLIPVSASN
jgi:hypothetical protein